MGPSSTDSAVLDGLMLVLPLCIAAATLALVLAAFRAHRASLAKQEAMLLRLLTMIEKIERRQRDLRHIADSVRTIEAIVEERALQRAKGETRPADAD